MKHSSFSLGQKSIAIAIAALLFLSGCSSPFATKETSTDIAVLPSVQAMPITRTVLRPTLTISGTVQAQEEITIASEVNGTVARVLKKEGQTVKPNDLIMQLGGSDNMLSISFASAQRAMNNAAKLVELTRQAGLKQIKNAEIAAEKAKISLQKLENTKKLNKTAQKSQTSTMQSAFEAAKTGLALAKKAEEDVKQNEQKTHNNLIESASNAVYSSMVPLNASVQWVDTMLGISEVHKTDNDDFEVYIFGNTPYATKQTALNQWFSVESQRKALNTAIKEANKETIAQTLLQTIQVLKENRALLRSFDEILQYSFVTPQFPQARLDAIKSQVQAYLQSIETSLSSLTAAEQALSNFAIQSPQRILDASLNVSVAETKLISAESQLVAAQSTEGTSDITIDASIEEAKNAVAAALANVEFAKVQAGLSNQSSISQLSAAQSSVDSASFSLSKLSIVSRIGGTITKVLKKDGDTIQAGTPLVVISNVAALKLVSDVSVEESLQLQIGMPAKITIPGTSQEFTGSLFLIYPEADKVTRRVKIEILIPNIRKIPTNTFATATLQLPALPPAIYVPMTALVSQNPPSVMVAHPTENGEYVLKKTIVELGTQYADNVMITKGLRPQDMVVVESYPTLFDGDKVLVSPPKDTSSILPVSEPSLSSPFPSAAISSLEPSRKDPIQKLWETKRSL